MSAIAAAPFGDSVGIAGRTTTPLSGYNQFSYYDVYFGQGIWIFTQNSRIHFFSLGNSLIQYGYDDTPTVIGYLVDPNS